jgi:hypothetical protein
MAKPMITGKGFEILLASPPECESLVAEIYCDGKFLALVSQEKGLGAFEIETPGPGLVEERVVRKADLSGFLKAVELACQRLLGGSP